MYNIYKVYMINKKISVLMSFLNAEKYLKESINSILRQNYSNFEFIILDDGSTDKSSKILNQFEDNRIIKLTNSVNMGVPYSFNKMIQYAKGEYIAFMDADDISLKTRLSDQLKYLEDNNIDMCGSSAKQFGNIRNKHLKTFEKLEDIKTLMIVGNPIINSTVMIKANILKKFECNTNLISWDYDLHTKIILNDYKINNLNKVLLKSRSHSRQDSTVNFDRGIKDSYEISKNYFLAQKNIQQFKKYLYSSKFGYAKNINIKSYFKTLLAFKKIMIINKSSHQILNILNTDLILKLYPINIFIFIRILKIFKKFKINISQKQFILLLTRSIFIIKPDSKKIKKLISVYYFFKKFK